MATRSIALSALMILTLLCPVRTALANIALDSGFGVDGRIAVDLGVLTDRAHAVAIQENGKILVAGSSSSSANQDFALIRLDTDDSLDTEFNYDGTVILPVGRYDDEALALAILEDGRIVAAGYAENGQDRDFALACFMEDGSLDESFGQNGLVITPVGNSHEEITALHIDDQGGILVAGTAEGTVGRILVVGRYTSDGTLDESFADAGLALIGLGDDVLAQGVGVLPDGKIVVSGSYGDGQAPVMMVAGFTGQGELDTGFGQNGIAVLDSPGQGSEGFGLLVDDEGGVLVAGSSGLAPERDAALFRFTFFGEPDTRFGNQGMLTVTQGEGDEVLFSLDAKDGRLNASGFATEGEERSFLVVSVDTSVQAPSTKTTGTDALPAGKSLYISDLQVADNLESYQAAQSDSGAGPTLTTTRFGAPDAVSYAMVIQEDGKAIAVGTSTSSGDDSTIVLARYGDQKNTSSGAKNSTGREVATTDASSSQWILTKEASSVNRTGAITGGEILAGFGEVVEQRGIVWSMAPDPVLREDLPDETEDGNDNGDGEEEITEKDNLVTYQGKEEPLKLNGATYLLRKSVRAVGDFLVPAALAENGDEEDGGGFISDPREEDYDKNGQTEDGQGLGRYSSILEDLKPGTTYYVRAYAVTDEGLIRYGNEISFRTADACFIATAAFGSILDPHVTVLRDFRDRYLVKSTLGNQLVSLYYKTSPPLADRVASSSLLKFLVRTLLLPVIGIAWLIMHLGVTGGVTVLVAGGFTVFAVKRCVSQRLIISQ